MCWYCDDGNDDIKVEKDKEEEEDVGGSDREGDSGAESDVGGGNDVDGGGSVIGAVPDVAEERSGHGNDDGSDNGSIYNGRRSRGCNGVVDGEEDDAGGKKRLRRVKSWGRRNKQ